MTDLRQTLEYSKYMQALGWSVITTPLHSAVVNQIISYVYMKKIPLMGSIVKLQRPEGTINFNEIKHLIEIYKIAAFYLEPSQSTKYKMPNIFKHARSAFLPSKTIQINLTKTEEQLLKEMKSKTRYNIGLAKKRGVVIKESIRIEEFVNLWKSSARRRLALPQSKEIAALWQAFVKKAHLLLAYKENSLLAGILLARSPDTAFYMYAGSTREGKKLFAPTLVAWEAIRLAKKLRCKTFDFEGIYDPRYSSTKSWRGFTRFKEGFGGKVVEYPKTLVYFKNPLLGLINL